MSGAKRIQQRTGTMVAAAAVGFLAALSGQNTAAYRVAEGAATLYRLDRADGNVTVTAVSTQRVSASIVPKAKTSPGKADELTGTVLDQPPAPQLGAVAGETDLEYAGEFGSVFGLATGGHTLYVTYPDTEISLTIYATAANGSLMIERAAYKAGCGDALSRSSEAYLDEWVAAVRGGISVPAGSHVELRIPHPSQKAKLPAGENDSQRTQCASIFPSTKYYELKIDSVPPQARVYIGGKYIGLAGSPIKVNRNPAHVLVRLAGCRDLPTSIPLQDGPNNVSVTLAGCAK